MTLGDREQIEHLGLIGVGLLGTALAERLLGQEFAVSGFDVDSQRLQYLASAGGRVCHDASEVFTNCDTVLLSLPTSDIVHELLVGNASALRDGLTIVDTTTGDPQQMVEIGEVLLQRRVNYVEATVAGSSEQLRTGRATLFVGGDATVVERIQPVLTSVAAKHFHLGAVGSASRFKLVHNLLLGLHRAVLAEGLTFAESAGFDPARTLEILQQTPAASSVMETKGKKMVTGDREPQARLSQHLKDVRLILAEAERVGATTPLTETHRTLLERAEQLGFGDADNSAVIEAFRRQTPTG